MNFPNAPFQSVITEMGGKLSSVWSQWISRLEYIVKTLTMAGKTSERPTERLWTGQRYYDSTLNQLVFWNGSEWLSAAVGYYASFYDTTNQTAANTTTAYPITCNTPNGADGISLVDDSKITFAHPGRYNIQFSFQFVNTETNASNPAEVNIWFRLNGQDVDYSNSRFSIPNKHGFHNGHLIAAMNFIVETTSNNEYAQIMWQTENTTISIETLAAGTTPTTPVTPSVIITAQQI
jgi:hypothetical protein